MEFKEILRRRRSVRKYLSRPVEREVLDTGDHGDGPVVRGHRCGAGLLLGACERTSLPEGSARRSAGGRLSAGVPSRPGGARHPVRRRPGLLRLRACGPAPVRCGNAYPLAGKVAGSNRVRGGRVSGRTSFGRFMSFAGACIGNPAIRLSLVEFIFFAAKIRFVE